MSSVFQYLYNSHGQWIAFRQGEFVYNKSGQWIGWLPWGDADVVDKSGKYLGTIVDQDRFYHFRGHPYRGYPGYPGYPGFAGYPGYPGYAGYSPLPPMAEDIAQIEGN